MPDIYRMIDRFRTEQLRRERAAATAMVRAYGQIWQQLNREIKETVKRYYAMLEAGQETAAAIYRMDRLTALQAQVEAQLLQFSQFADATVRAQQYEAIQAGAEHGFRLMETAGEGVYYNFNRLPTAALGNLVGMLQDGSPLMQVLRGYAGAGAQAAADMLTMGLALGYNPQRTARLIRKALGGNLADYLRIARTETLRAYREASHQTYLQNGDVIEGWIWVSARNTRTCACCWAMDGTFHKPEERLDDHPNGRCTAAPKVKGIDFPLRTTGVEAFGRLWDGEQLAVLGPAKYAAFKSGEIDLKQLIGVKRDRVWGRMFYERSLRQLDINAREMLQLYQEEYRVTL